MRGSHIRPTSLSHAREKSWLIVSTMAPLHTVTQYHKLLSSPTLLLYYAAVAYKSTCDVCKCAEPTTLNKEKQIVKIGQSKML